MDSNSDSSSVDLTPRRGQIDLSIVDVVSSYDDQSHLQSLPSDVYEEKEKKEHQADNDKPTSSRSNRSSLGSRRQAQQHQQTSNGEMQEENQGVQTPPSANPLRHYNLVKLADAFFIIASVLFFWASWLESMEYSNNTRSITFLSNGSSDTSRPPSGYHLKLSTNIDTYVTKQMILMLASTFCLLQVGIINLVRTPLEKFHFFQIAAGLFGLVSSMFWESTSILSDISYFFFVHAMTGQALMLLHYHFRTLIQPFRLELRQQGQGTTSSKKHVKKSSRPLSPLSGSRLGSSRRREGHFALDSPNGNPPGIVNSIEDEERDRDYNSSNIYGLPDSDGNSLSEEPIFSLEEEDDDPEHYLRDGHRPQQHSDKELLSDSVKDDESVASQLVEAQHDSIKELTVGTYLRFGIIFGIADGFFVVGSLVETALTYVSILVINDDNDDTGAATIDNSTWNEAVSVLNLMPGILWFIFAWVSMMNTILLRRYVNTTTI